MTDQELIEALSPRDAKPSKVTEEALSEFEQELPAPLPPLYRQYLTTFVTREREEWDYENEILYLTGAPARNPLGRLTSMMLGCREILPAGYAYFSDYRDDGWAMVCFDMHNRSAEGDCPLVWVDHETLVPLSATERGEREIIEPLMAALCPSFRCLIEALVKRK